MNIWYVVVLLSALLRLIMSHTNTVWYIAGITCMALRIVPDVYIYKHCIHVDIHFLKFFTYPECIIPDFQRDRKLCAFHVCPTVSSTSPSYQNLSANFRWQWLCSTGCGSCQDNGKEIAYNFLGRSPWQFPLRWYGWESGILAVVVEWLCLCVPWRSLYAYDSCSIDRCNKVISRRYGHQFNV